MLKKRKTAAVLMLTALVSAAMPAAETKGRLVVKGAKFQNDRGGAILYLYKKTDNIRGDGFIKVKSEIKSGVSSFAVDNIDYGEYGIKVVHDENGNGKMDMGIFGVEGVGFSKEIKINKGLAFDDIKTNFDSQDSEINVQMQYPTLTGIILESTKLNP